MAVTSSRLLYFCLLFCLSSSSPTLPTSRSRKLVDRTDLVTLIPQQSCYYQGYNKRLTCNCNSTDTSAYLHLRMKYYVFNAGNEIREVHLQQCRHLLMTLDLRQVDATNFPVHFKQMRKVEIEKIMFEPKFSDRQELQLEFYNVEQLLFNKIFVEDTLKLRATNVKEARFIKSTFEHIPPNGFQISRAKILDIRDSNFLRVSPKSIVVEKTKDVTVLKNEMTINALEVVYAKDGSHLMISCNRLLGQPISPECSKTTTTTTTTTTQPPPPFLLNQGNLREGNVRNGAGEDRGATDPFRGLLPELIAGAVAGLVIITIAILLFICFIRRKKKNREEEGGGYLAAAPIPSPLKEKKEEELEKAAAVSPVKAAPVNAETASPPVVTPKPSPRMNGKKEAQESDSLLAVPGASDEDDDDKPKFSSPIWLEDLHKNKIFNRQKSLLSREGLKEIAEGKGQPRIDENNPGLAAIKGQSPPIPAPRSPRVGAISAAATDHHSEDEIKESSRTESDEDFDKHNNAHNPDEIMMTKLPMDGLPVRQGDPTSPDGSRPQSPEIDHLMEKVKRQEMDLTSE